jgi:hypothetical protein
MRLVPTLHSRNNEEITPEQRHIAATAIVVSKMLKLERRNFELYQQPLRILVNAPPFSTADFQVPVRFMELLDPKRTMMAIEQVDFKCMSCSRLLNPPRYNPVDIGVCPTFGNLYIDCESVPSGTAFNTETISYSKNIKSVPTTYAPQSYGTESNGGSTSQFLTLSSHYNTNIKSNQIEFRLSDVNFLNNSMIRFLLRIGYFIQNSPGAGYQTAPMFNLGTTATPAPNTTPAREPLDTLNGFLTFSVVFYRYSGNDDADEE